MTSNMSSSALRKKCYTWPKLYLPQVAPLDVQRLTHGAKYFGTGPTKLPSLLGVNTSCAAGEVLSKCV